jgi:16S rRNA processing protein RimM
MGKDAYLLVGRIVGHHGIGGELKVKTYSGDSFNLCKDKEIFLQHKKSNDFMPFKIQQVRGTLKKIILSIKGVDDLDHALAFIGMDIWMAKKDLQHPDKDEFYWYQLIGMTVMTYEGNIMGTLENIIETGANDVYVVKQGENEYLVPALKDVVESVDLNKGIIIVNMIPEAKQINAF